MRTAFRIPTPTTYRPTHPPSGLRCNLRQNPERSESRTYDLALEAHVIPYRADDADDPTQAVPFVTVGLIIVNFLVFFYELSLSTQGTQFDTFINGYALVPCEYTGRCAIASGTPSPFWLTLFSSMFLHAGWAHILGNMLF